MIRIKLEAVDNYPEEIREFTLKDAELRLGTDEAEEVKWVVLNPILRKVSTSIIPQIERRSDNKWYFARMDTSYGVGASRAPERLKGILGNTAEEAAETLIDIIIEDCSQQLKRVIPGVEYKEAFMNIIYDFLENSFDLVEDPEEHDYGKFGDEISAYVKIKPNAKQFKPISDDIVRKFINYVYNTGEWKTSGLSTAVEKGTNLKRSNPYGGRPDKYLGIATHWYSYSGFAKNSQDVLYLVSVHSAFSKGDDIAEVSISFKS